MNAPNETTFQRHVADWMDQCFDKLLYANMMERGDRLLEEVLELLQSGGYDPTRVGTLVSYVWGRPVGEPAQEVGGVMITLAGYCAVAGLDMHAAAQAELSRITRPEVMQRIREKQAAKNALHFDTPLPGQHPDDIAVDRFAAAMKAKLAAKRAEGRGGWDDKSQCSQQHLSNLLHSHAAKGDPVDVGNFTMMLHQRGESILPAEQPAAQETNHPEIPDSSVCAERPAVVPGWKLVPTELTAEMEAAGWPADTAAEGYRAMLAAAPAVAKAELAAAQEAVAVVTLSQRPDALGSRMSLVRLTDAAKGLPAGRHSLYIHPADPAAAPDNYVPSPDEVAAWMERSDIDGGSIEHWRTAIDDARSMHLLTAREGQSNG